MNRPDERLEAFHLWTQDDRRPRFDWICAALWTGVAVFCLAFWAGVAWVIASVVMAL